VQIENGFQVSTDAGQRSFGGPRRLLHFGTAYKLSPLRQIDFHVGRVCRARRSIASSASAIRFDTKPGNDSARLQLE
jgi:hypothetical protein